MQQDLEDFVAHAARMPSLGGNEIGPSLRAAAAAVPEGMAIVELGAWLGAGTAQLALGALERAPPPVIHSYDRFEALYGEVRMAAERGVILKRGQDTLPFVRNMLGSLAAPIAFHKGDLVEQRWNEGAIGLHVDDAAKQPDEFRYVLRTFGPSWVPGTTLVMLMDYHFWREFPPGEQANRLRAQHDFVSAHPDAFAPVDADAAGTTTAFFRYMGGIDFAALPPLAPLPPLPAAARQRVLRALRRLKRGLLGG